MKRKVLAAALSAVMVLAMAGCSSSTEATTEATTEAATEATTEAATEEATEAVASSDLTIGISIDQLFDSRVATVMGIEDAGEAAGVTMVELVADGDAQSQNDQINTLINQGVDGLLICPVDLNTIETALIAAKVAEIPVVLYDRDSPDSENVITAVSCGAYEDGYQGGEYIANTLAEMDLDSYVIADLKGPDSDDVGVQRSAGFNDSITDILGDKATVITVETGAWDTATATANFQSTLQANPEICAVFCGTDSFIPGVETVLTDAGRMNVVGEEGHVVITGINGSLEGYEAVVNGIADGTVVMDCPNTGIQAMEALLAYLADGTTPERTIIVPSVFYTGDDIEANADSIWGVMDLSLSYQ
ncbi:MAG: sugar ABC transporter substrate-binding protein [Eubacteriales bacterium]